MSLLRSSEYFMLMELLTYRFSEAKCSGQAPQAGGLTLLKLQLIIKMQPHGGDMLIACLQLKNFARGDNQSPVVSRRG
jgi:hypothetical protein